MVWSGKGVIGSNGKLKLRSSGSADVCGTCCEPPCWASAVELTFTGITPRPGCFTFTTYQGGYPWSYRWISAPPMNGVYVLTRGPTGNYSSGAILGSYAIEGSWSDICAAEGSATYPFGHYSIDLYESSGSLRIDMSCLYYRVFPLFSILSPTCAGTTIANQVSTTWSAWYAEGGTVTWRWLP